MLHESNLPRARGDKRGNEDKNGKTKNKNKTPKVKYRQMGSTKMQARTKALAERLLRDKKWTEHLDIYTPREIDCLTRWFKHQRRKNSHWGVVWLVVSTTAFVCGYELFWDDVGLTHVNGACASPTEASSAGITASIYILQGLFTITSLLLARCALTHHKAQYYLNLIDRTYDNTDAFWESTRGLMCFIEVIVVGSHIPVGVSGCFDVESQTAVDEGAMIPTPYQTLNVFSFVRIYLLYRLLSYNSRFSSQTALMVLSLYEQKTNRVLAFKDALSTGLTGPFFFLVLYNSSIIVFGYAVLLFERGAIHAEAAYETTFLTATWYLWTAITTTGSGDWLPSSSLSRAMSYLGGMWGTMCSAVILSYGSSFMKMTMEEQKVSYTMTWLRQKQELPVRAVTVIQVWWREFKPVRDADGKIVKRPLPKQRRGSLAARGLAKKTDHHYLSPRLKKELNWWRYQRLQYIQKLADSSDPNDVMPHVMGVEYEVQNLFTKVSTVKDEMVELSTHLERVASKLENLKHVK